MLRTFHLCRGVLALAGSCQGGAGQQQGVLLGGASPQKTSRHCQVHTVHIACSPDHHQMIVPSGCVFHPAGMSRLAMGNHAPTAYGLSGLGRWVVGD